MYVAQPIEWTEQGVVMLDQRRLPAEEASYTYTDYRDVAKAIREMVIRGAPAIGVAAAMGVALGVQKSTARTRVELHSEFAVLCETLAKTRPTAVDLAWRSSGARLEPKFLCYRGIDGENTGIRRKKPDFPSRIAA